MDERIHSGNAFQASTCHARKSGASLGFRLGAWALVLGLAGCAKSDAPSATNDNEPAPAQGAQGSLADVVSVRVSGQAGAYSFDVGIRSPDEGCEQYADWWELIGLNGTLLHRRVLGHSHVGEQPFVRRGGPLAVDADRLLWVRAHMHPGGYGGAAFQGSVAGGFEPTPLDASFAAQLANSAPKPPDCDH